MRSPRFVAWWPTLFLASITVSVLLAAPKARMCRTAVSGSVVIHGRPASGGTVRFSVGDRLGITVPITSDGTYSVELPCGRYVQAVVARNCLGESFRQEKSVCVKGRAMRLTLLDKR